jgi:hypothetical protein
MSTFYEKRGLGYDKLKMHYFFRDVGKISNTFAVMI